VGRFRNAERVKTQAEDPARTTDDPVDVVVSFASRIGPVAGTVSGTPTGPTSPFHGWLELMDVVEALRTGAGEETGIEAGP
jgi:hypothetical protein